MYVDADTHVDECESTWSYLPKSQEDMLPRTVQFSDEEMPSWLGGDRSSGSGYQRCWFIDGQLYPRRIRSDSRTGTTQETRELEEPAKRIADMDALGIDTQVIFPTLFLNEVTRRSELEVALYRSYNRWLAERTEASGGRLRWVAMIPFSNPIAAVEEAEFAKAHGAVGAFKRGIEGGGRAAGDPHFYGVYDALAQLDLALCIHNARSWTASQSPYTLRPLSSSDAFPVVSAFSSLLDEKVTERFPALRVGFIESASAWITFILGRAGWHVRRGERGERSLADVNFYVTCEVYEDIPYLIEVAGGAENFLIGTDYCHGDRASVINAHRIVTERGDLDEKDAARITSDNARSFYRL